MREALVHRVVHQGILHRSETQKIVDLDGGSARWVLDSLGFSMTGDGAQLAARALLERLDAFEGRQLATYGTTAIPLMQAVILASGGRYRGLLVRKDIKPYGAQRRIDGRIDPREPVILFDDSVSSGWSMLRCAEHLKQAGLEIEGGVSLVRFGWDGVARVQRVLGRRVLSVLDVDKDLAPRMPNEPFVPANRSRVPEPLQRSARSAPEGIDACDLARLAIEEWLARHQLLRAPKRLDRAWDHAGGTHVSLRRRADVHDRLARDGFWLFPGERAGTLGEDVVLAAVQTAMKLERDHKRARKGLDECAIAVTFFGALEACEVGELDNSRYGIVVRSTERPERLGGALPNMPGIRDAWGQFRHAAFNNARIDDDEPYALWRHEVYKCVERGQVWQPTGVPTREAVAPWEASLSNVQPVVRRARARVLAALGLEASGSEPVGDVPADVMYVTAWVDGRLIGCTGMAVSGAADEVIDRLAVATAGDDRFGRPQNIDPRRVAVSVSFLRNRLDLGPGADAQWASQATRFAQQALEVEQGSRRGLLLPLVAVRDDLSPLAFARAVVEKAGAVEPCRWIRWDCASWLDDGAQTRKLDGALPAAEPTGSLERQGEQLLSLWAGFLGRHHNPRGASVVRYLPFHDVQRTQDVPVWLAHRAWVKARLGWKRQALDDLARLKLRRAPDGRFWARGSREQQTVAEVAFALLAACALGQRRRAQALASSLWSSFDERGVLRTHREGDGNEGAQDYCAGQVLLALAVAAEKSLTQTAPVLPKALAYYRRRFRGQRCWGSVSWLTQAYCAWGRVLDDAQWTRFACEIVDWTLPSQSREHGGFLNLEQEDAPGALTAVYLEAVAAVLKATGKAKYREALHRGLHFLDRLTYQPRDAAVLPNVEAAIGGLRSSLTAGEVRLDFVQHALSALLELHPEAR
jgi:orotate phosphoribosyltransferase/AMMECR1 domain-containing protein